MGSSFITHKGSFDQGQLGGWDIARRPNRRTGRNEQQQASLLGGWNAVEEPAFGPLALPHATPQKLKAATTEIFGESRMAEFRALHPARDLAETQAAASTLVGDVVIAGLDVTDARLAERTGRSPVFAYRFSCASPYSPLASHVADVPFVAHSAATAASRRFGAPWARIEGTDAGSAKGPMPPPRS